MKTPIKTQLNLPVEKLPRGDLLTQWATELDALKRMELTNPGWDWKTVQQHLERVYALAQELRNHSARQQAK